MAVTETNDDTFTTEEYSMLKYLLNDQARRPSSSRYPHGKVCLLLGRVRAILAQKEAGDDPTKHGS